MHVDGPPTQLRQVSAWAFRPALQDLELAVAHFLSYQLLQNLNAIVILALSTAVSILTATLIVPRVELIGTLLDGLKLFAR